MDKYSLGYFKGIAKQGEKKKLSLINNIAIGKD